MKLVETVVCLRINCPDLFRDQEFVQWLNSCPALATWHVSGKPPDEMSDVFVTYDGGEGSDFESMPEAAWDRLCEVCRAAGVVYAVLWLTNIDEDGE